MREANKLKKFHYERPIKTVNKIVTPLKVGGAEGRKTSLSFLFESFKKTFGWKRRVSELISKEVAFTEKQSR